MTINENDALKCLASVYPDLCVDLLGNGKASYIFTDYYQVFKVCFKSMNVDFLTYISENQIFKHCKTIYNLTKIISLQNHTIIIYPYEKSETCYKLYEEELLNFLVECWQCKVIFKDIKPSNFIRVDEQLKYIDYEPDTYSDNLFLNMAARAYVYTQYADHDTIWLKKLCRTAINQFNIPELSGFQEFANNLFGKIIYAESIPSYTYSTFNFSHANIAQINTAGNYTISYDEQINPENIFWQLLNQNIYMNDIGINSLPILNQSNYFEPTQLYIQTIPITPPSQPVSLIIKACTQDAPVLIQLVKHIVRQLATPNNFHEIILALDTRQHDFLRAYNEESSWQELIEIADYLIQMKLITSYIFPSQNDIIATNIKWFGIATYQTHTIDKIPIASQLFAFDQAECDYILQVDCDVMIGRLDKKHSFLEDMIKAIDDNKQVLSVGFNIYKGKNTEFNPYFGFDNGGFVPEVRFCLLKKSRINAILPIPNEITNTGFKLSWYRALEKYQKTTQTSSIRGGDSRSFYIHIQNFKKTNKDTWFTILDRVEQLQIPHQQINEFDLAGSYYDWGLATRHEKMIIVSCLYNISLPRFLRYWYSLISQSFTDWGLILIDDASDNGLSYYINNLITPFRDKITFIRNSFRVEVAQNTYKAIHYLTHNINSIICILDADDALIGRDSLNEIIKKYNIDNTDVVIGKMYRTDKITAHYSYPINFSNPRLYGGNVWQHIRTFRKYLFDSLQLSDFKIPIDTPSKNSQDILLSKRFYSTQEFPKYCWDFAYMIPIVEMSENPMWLDNFNILHERSTPNTPEIKQQKELIIAKICSKTPKTPTDIIKSRRSFIPNLSQIEIDITYDCNLKCVNCNRSSTQAPTRKGISIKKIIQFIEESIELKKQWKLINILGGEPTLHPNFLAIIELILFEYIEPYSPQTILQITSNGYGDEVNRQLTQLPQHPNLIIDTASYKNANIVPYFSPFNNAPIDNQEHINNNEYHKGCWVTSYCGIGLNELGYYPCGVAGGIDRIFEFNLGKNSLHDIDDSFRNLLDTFCRYCGNFNDYAMNKGDFIPRYEKAALNKAIVSKTWQQQYRKYNGKK